MYLRLVVSVFIIFIALTSTSAQNSYLVRMDASVVKNKIFLSWTTKAGFTCEDIYIEIANDTSNFKTAGIIYGICGDTAEKDYGYVIDSTFTNQLNYVRIKLGGFGYSETLAVRVISATNNLLIVPHPANYSSELFFNNPLQKKTIIQFYSITGQFVTQVETDKQFLKFQDLSLKSGTYFLIITKEKDAPQRGTCIYKEL